MEYFDFTNSGLVNNAYKRFYNKNGYIPEMFQPYNCAEITDIAPTITAAIGSGTSSADVWFVKEYYYESNE